MFKHYFELVQNVAIYPIISLTIFFTFFIGLIIWVYRKDKNHVAKMSHMPLELDDESEII